MICRRCFVLEKVKIPPPFSAPNVAAKFMADTSLLYRDSSSLKRSPPPVLTPPPATHHSPRSTFQIQFDFRGKVYTGTRDPNGNTNPDDDLFRFVRMQFPDLDGDGVFGEDAELPQSAAPAAATGAAFSIFLPPKRTAASRLELPTGAYIDLITSGIAAHQIYAPSLASNPTPADFEGVFYHDVGYLPDNGPMPPPPLAPDSHPVRQPGWPGARLG